MSALWLCTLVLLATLVCVQLQEDGDYDELDSVLLGYETLYTHHFTHTVTAHPHSRRIQFSTHGRDFELHLVPSQRFTSDFTAHTHNADGNLSPFHINKQEFYEGYVHGEKDSRVTAHVSSSGILTAHIATHNESFHIEPSSHLLTRPHSFHMIAYCGSQVKDRLSRARVDYTVAPSIPHADLYREQSHSSLKFESSRLKRQSFPGRITDSSCPMFLVAHNSMFKLLGDRESAASRMIQLVLSIDSEIYRGTEWIVSPDLTSVSGLGLSIGQVLVHEAPDTSVYEYNTPGELDAGQLLGLMRFNDWRNYCLVHLFVGYGFSSGLLGLANIASPAPSQTGGICSIRFRDRSIGRDVMYNTGLTSLVNRGQLMIMSELLRVTGHEIGHNWGAHHDTSTCGPGWLMNEYSQDGSQPTHTMFSQCSRISIGSVLLNKASCFQPLSDKDCGNFRLDPDEACDVGGQMDDPCCTPECTFRNDNFTCSDFNSECCVNCTTASNTRVCREERMVTPDCVLSTYCDGVNSDCPDERPSAPVGTSCINGVCNNVDGSVVCEPLCEANRTCVCSGALECLLCCRGADEECEPLANMTLFRSNGAPCSVGACFEGNCTRDTQTDEISRIWQIIVTLDVDAFRVLLRENLVGWVLIFSLFCWCPMTCLIHNCYDYPIWERCEKKEETDLAAWMDERTVAYQSFTKAPPIAAEDEQKQPLLESVEEEERARSSSPVDTLPPPTYS